MKLKNTTYKDLWVSDFDKDGTPNIDDIKPFDKKVKIMVNPEVSVSNAYSKLEETRESYKPDLEKLKIKLKTCQGRVKDQYSAIGKQLGRNIVTLDDLGGLRIIKDKRKDVYKEVKRIKKIFKKCSNKVKNNCIKEIDDKYKSKKNFPYMAVHIDLKYKGKPYEVQIKTEKMSVHQDKVHPCYKNRDVKCLSEIKRDVRKLYKKGY